MLREKPIRGYMDKVDFDHELGHNSAGNKIYPSPEALLRRQLCAEECGIVEVEVRLKRVVLQGKV